MIMEMKSIFLSRFYHEKDWTKIFVGRSRAQCILANPASTAYKRQDKTHMKTEKNKTDCVGFMLQNRDN